MASMMLLATRSGRSTASPPATTDRTPRTACCSTCARARGTRCDAFVPRGSHVIDLGCGPGRDAEHLARARLPRDGHRLVARRWWTRRAARARRRGVGGSRRRPARSASTRSTGWRRCSSTPRTRTSARSTASTISPRAARLIADRLRPGGVLVASVIGRVCPWEMALYLARGRWWRAAIRFRARSGAGAARRPDGVDAVLHARAASRGSSPRPGSRARLSAPSACSRRRRISRRSPAAIRASSRALQRVEDRVGGWPGIRAWGDHFLIVLRKA